jgi:Holliday junction resolvasome RuvABC ATP-dependent DNA helicase subunit
MKCIVEFSAIQYEDGGNQPSSLEVEIADDSVNESTDLQRYINKNGQEIIFNESGRIANRFRWQIIWEEETDEEETDEEETDEEEPDDEEETEERNEMSSLPRCRTTEQQELRFWCDPAEAPSVELRKWMANRENPACPLSKFVGSSESLRFLSDAAFAAFGKEDHCCADFAFALCGPPSCGKSTLAKLFAATVGLPFIKILPQEFTSMRKLFSLVANHLYHNEKHVGTVTGERVYLDLVDLGGGTYTFPPMVIFIDEVHELDKKLAKGPLLPAIEPDDLHFTTEDGIKVNTSFVCWIIATTDRGDLFDAFDSRFEKIELRMYTTEEMEKIVKVNDPGLPDEVYKLVAHYCGQVPREALRFVRHLRIVKEQMPNSTWEEVAAEVAGIRGIDEYGMTKTRLNVLKALGRRPISAEQLTIFAGVKENELRKYVLPPLIGVTPEQQQPLVTMSSKGYTITPAGLAELDKRGIDNMGMEAIPEQVRVLYA